MLTERFEMRFPPDLIESIDQWRATQAVPPSRAAAIRYLVELGLKGADTIPIRGQKPEPAAGGGSSKPGDTKPAARPRKPEAPNAAPASKMEQLRALREQATR